MANPALNIDDLSPDDRLRLLEQIWESLRKSEESIPLSDAQRDDLDHRLNEVEKDGGHGIPWDEVLRRIQGRR